MRSGTNNKKRIGIIGAMDEEIKFFVDKMDGVKEYKKAGFIFYTGILKKAEIVVVECGIGKVNAAICTQLMIDIFDVRCVICSGVAGAIDPKLKIGDIVISKDVIQHDINVAAFGYKRGLIPRMNIRAFPADERLVKLFYEKAGSIIKNQTVIKGRILTGDTFISDSNKKIELRNIFNGSCVEMEGAAIGHVCYLNKVPFVIIRSISDTADGRSMEDFKKFVDLAAKNSFFIISSIINNLMV